VPVDLKTHEWNSLRDQFRTLVHNEGGREDSLEQFVDDGIRRRFGELISRACLGNGKQTFPARFGERLRCASPGAAIAGSS
jgi:hypothetical protein